MAKKRAAGTGSIYPLPNGTWRALVTIQGNRISHTAKNQRAAAEWARKTVDQVGQGLTYDATQKDLATFIQEWLAIKKTQRRILTIESYSRLIRLYIIPHIGTVLLKDISAARIQALYSELQAEGLGKRTIEIIHTVLHGCLHYARKLGLVSQNWADLVEPPHPEKREMSIWTEDQVSSFLVAYPDNLFFRLAFVTGMRRAELIGLQWSDLDWRTETIRVNRQVIEPAGGGFLFKEPKSNRGYRAIRLDHETIKELKYYFNQVIPLARMVAGDHWQENDLIFPTQKGTPRNGYEVSKEFKRLLRKVNLPEIRFHDIRHTNASILLLHGEPPVRVAARLGQSIAVLLDTYAHYVQDDQAEAAALMGEITTPVSIDLKL